MPHDANGYRVKHDQDQTESKLGLGLCIIPKLSVISYIVAAKLMKNLDIIVEPPVSMISDSVVVTNYNISGGNLYGWLISCHGFWHNIGLIVPSFIFVMFLVFQAKKSFVKLSNGGSLVIIAYYAFLWLVSLFNLSWCFLQVCYVFLG